jgi:hypothetical protein
MRYYEPVAVLKLSTAFFTVVFIQSSLDGYKAYVEHNNVFLASDESLEQLKLIVEDMIISKYKQELKFIEEQRNDC